jgi:hypothetical protein
MPERRANHLTRTFVAEMSQKEEKRAELVSDRGGSPNHFSLQELWADDMGITIEELLNGKKSGGIAL